MQQQSFILSLRQRFKWLPKASLPKLLSSICTRTTEVGGGQIVGGNIRLAPCVERLSFCITIMSITQTTALSMFYLGKNSFRDISLILKTAFNIKVSHTTVSNWCVKFAPLFDDMRIQLVSLLDLNSDEWHADETVVKIAGVKHYIWFIIDSETRFVIGFHLSPHRDSPQAVSLFSEVVKLGKPSAIVSDRYSAYKVPVKSIFDGAKHIRVQSLLPTVG